MIPRCPECGTPVCRHEGRWFCTVCVSPVVPRFMELGGRGDGTPAYRARHPERAVAK